MTPLWNQPDWPVPWCVVVVASLAVAWIDTRTQRIPNLLTGPLCLGGWIWSVYAGGIWGLGESVAAMILLALPFVVLYALAGGGAGDAKMMGAIGAWTGLIGGGVVLVAVSIAGGVLAVIFALAKRRGAETTEKLWGILTGWMLLAKGRVNVRDLEQFHPARGQTIPMPYGPAIAAGVILSAGGIVLWRIR